MNEDFLHFVWKQRLFLSEYTYTTSGDRVHVIDVGQHNMDAGPDFFDARIRINDTLWAGNVEIHQKASQWNRHGHQTDAAYDNVILHAVGVADQQIRTKSGRPIPCMILQFPEQLCAQYQHLLANEKWVHCQDDLQCVDKFFLNSWLDRMTVERLEQKAQTISMVLEKNTNSWEETFYQFLARHLGMKVNADPFEMLARSLPLNRLARQKNSLMQLEALFFGQAGLLNESLLGDDYFMSLKQEYQFLREKFKLRPLFPAQWKYLRLRPNNFPTIRIAQLSSLIFRSQSLFSQVLEIRDIESLKTLLRVKASSYWENHYRFGKESCDSPKEIGDFTLNILLINVVVPFLFLYGAYHRREDLRQRAINFLTSLPAENNGVVRRWKDMRVGASSAFQSQALLQLKTNYCDAHRCLECELGNRIIRSCLVK